jgi:hypothetical protein
MVRIKYPIREYRKLYNGKKIYWFTSNYFWLCDYDNKENLDIVTNPVTIYSLDSDDDYLTDSDTYPDFFAREEKVDLFFLTNLNYGRHSEESVCFDELIVNYEIKDKRFLDAVTIR